MSEIFEIHITGDRRIHKICEALNVKTIEIGLQNKKNHIIRYEDMTSYVFKGSELECYHNILDLVGKLQNFGVDIFRMKIETPVCDHFVEKSLYMESHFTSDEFVLPTSMNMRSKKLLATDREYDKSKYSIFQEKYKDKELELCIFDSFVQQDKDWFDLYV